MPRGEGKLWIRTVYILLKNWSYVASYFCGGVVIYIYIYIYIYNGDDEVLCCILTADPANYAIPKTVEVHIPFAWASMADNMGRYSHKLMHRKRVTSELHDSYFRSMTIKHAIPKMAEVHILMASYGEMNYYITQCTGNSRSLGIRRDGEMML